MKGLVIVVCTAQRALRAPQAFLKMDIVDAQVMSGAFAGGVRGHVCASEPTVTIFEVVDWPGCNNPKI